LIDRSVSSGGDAVCLTVDGWDFVGEKDKKDNNNGFIALWFENPNGDKIIKCMNDGIREAGYEPVCIKGSYFSGKIMDKALAEIKKSKFIVIDLTGERSSVFFEAGFAFALDKDIIYVCDKSEKGEFKDFYAKHFQCYFYEGVDLKETIKDAINARIK